MHIGELCCDNGCTRRGEKAGKSGDKRRGAFELRSKRSLSKQIHTQQPHRTLIQPRKGHDSFDNWCRLPQPGLDPKLEVEGLREACRPANDAVGRAADHVLGADVEASPRTLVREVYGNDYCDPQREAENSQAGLKRPSQEIA